MSQERPFNLTDRQAVNEAINEVKLADMENLFVIFCKNILMSTMNFEAEKADLAPREAKNFRSWQILQVTSPVLRSAQDIKTLIPEEQSRMELRSIVQY